jgi:hypothetical protein
MQSILDMQNLYWNEFTVDLDTFIANIFLEIRLYWDSRICGGVGY